MKKFIDFFIKHKKIFIIVSLIVLLAAVSLTAVTIALWNEEEEHTEIVTEPTNPATKYLEYYVVVENASSECGFDYYPTTRVPSEFKDRIIGLAVARYDGFASTVEIPQIATVDLKVDGTIYKNQSFDVIHVLANYSDTIGNGFSGTVDFEGDNVENFVSSIVLPETITYVHDDAFDKDDTIYVKGKITYKHLIPTTENEVKITGVVEGKTTIVDTLVKRDGYYLSTSTYIRHEYKDGNISYNSTQISVNGKTSNEINPLQIIYGLDDYTKVTYEDNNRNKYVSYSLSNADLFGSKSGVTTCVWNTNLFSGKTFVVTKDATTITIGKANADLEAGFKYYITYEGSIAEDGSINYTITPTKVTYKVGDTLLKLDTSNTNYESYYIDVEGENITVDEYYANDKKKTFNLNNKLDGKVELTFAPDTLFTDVDEKTLYSFNDIYYLHNVTETPNITYPSYSVTETPEENETIIFEATGYSGSTITGTPNVYTNAFVLSDTSLTYYVDNGATNNELVYYNGLYYAKLDASGVVKILGYKNGKEEYVSPSFSYESGKKYDLTSNESANTVDVTSLDINENYFIIESATSLSSITIDATYTDYSNTVTNGITVNLSLSEDTAYKYKVSIDDIAKINSIFANAVFSNEYKFTWYRITTNTGIVLYEYTYNSENGRLPEFYQKQYEIFRLNTSVLETNVFFDYKKLDDGSTTFNVNGNILTAIKTVKEYSYEVNGESPRLKRNFANIGFVEYYGSVESGNYYVSKNNSLEGINYKLDLYNATSGTLLYNPKGYSEEKYYLYTLDGIYVDTLVYQNGLLYTSAFDMNSYYGYYIVNEKYEVCNSYTDYSGSFEQLYDYYLVSTDLSLLNGYGLLKDSNNNYIIENVYLTTGTYYINNGVANLANEKTVGSDGYYDIKYALNEVTLTPSNKVEHLTASVMVDTKSYDLYQTNNSNIYSTFITVEASDSENVKVFDTNGDLVTTLSLDKGSYRIYVNLSDYTVNGYYGWKDRVYVSKVNVSNNNSEAISNVLKFNPYDKYLVVDNNAKITSNMVDYVPDTYKLDKSSYTVNGVKMFLAGDNYYEAIVKVNDRLSLDGSDKSITNLIPGTYQVYYDGSKLSCNRVEGSKQFTITINNNTYDMILNTSTTLYEEYMLEGSYSIDDNYKVLVIDDMGNKYELTLEGGLYTSLTFSIDNVRRYNDTYNIFVNLKGVKDDNCNEVTLHSDDKTVIYYYSNNTLPEYTDFFTEDGKVFSHWSITEGGSKVSDLSNKPSDLYAVMVNAYKVNINDGGCVKDLSDNEVTLFEYVKDEEITFKVVVEEGYTIESVSVGSQVLTPNGDVYSFKCNDILPPATISVVLKYPQTQYNSVNITLNSNGGSLDNSSVSYKVGTYDQLPIPTLTDYTFLYYYDTNTGTVYTDSNGNLLSPYMITKDISLTACYTNTYYVIVNSYNEDGTFNKSISSNPVQAGSLYTANFPREDGYHHSEITSVKTTSGYPVEFNINEYEHLYSFTMPNANVIINIKYKTDDTEISTNDKSDIIYVLIPTNFANNVGIYTGSSYSSMERLDGEYQIYPGFVAYTYNKFNCNKVKIQANGYYSYVYPYDSSNNLYIIDNFSLENEILYKYNWLEYTQNENVFTITNYDSDKIAVNAIHGDISTNDSFNVFSGKKFIGTEDDIWDNNTNDWGFAKLTDGSFDSNSGRFSTKKQGSDSNEAQWDSSVILDATMDLNGLYRLSTMELYCYANDITYAGANFTIELSNKGNIVKTISIDTNSDFASLIDGNRIKLDLGDVEATNVRIYSSAPVANKTISFYEIECYGSAIDADSSTVAVNKAINCDDKDYYQYAAFEVVVNNTNSPVKISFMVYYYADGKNNPILINDSEDFIDYVGNGSIKYQSGLKFKQTADIKVEDANGYNVIFNEDYPFNHTYDGNGKTITYLQESFRTNKNNGLFGYIGLNGVVMNLTIDYNIDSTNYENGHNAKYYIGSVAGVNKGTISFVTTTAKTITGYNLRYVGGIVGENNGKVNNCVNNIKYTINNYGVSDAYFIGGICGYNTNTVSNCSSVEIEVTNASERNSYSNQAVGLTVSKTMPITFVDDWYFANKKVKDGNQTYQLKSAAKVTYYNGTTNLGSIVYDINQAYQYDYMNTIDIAILANTTKIEVSRVMLITNDAEGNEVFYYSYNEEDGFVKLLDSDEKPYIEYVGYPDETYSVTLNDLNNRAYIYVTKSKEVYATSNNDNNIATSISSSLTVSSHLNVTNCNYDFRVIYYKDSSVVGVRSYSPGEQVVLYNGTTKMVFQKCIEGSITDIKEIDPSQYTTDTSISLDGTSINRFDPTAIKITDLSSFSQTFTLVNHEEFYTNYTTRVYFITSSKTYYYDFTDDDIKLPYFADITSLYITRTKNGSEYNGFYVSKVHKDKTVTIIEQSEGIYTASWTPDSYTIELNIDANVMMWNCYYVVVNDNYYLMERTDTRRFTATIYEDYKASNIILSSNPDLTDICQMTLTYSSNNSYTITSANSVYYLYGSMNNYVATDTKYQMYTDDNNKHYGFLDLSEQAIVKISNTEHEFILGAGLHMVVYDGTKTTIYSDKQAFNICFSSGDNNEYYGYSLGSSVKALDDNPTMESNAKYDYEFAGWKYNGKLYTAKNDLLCDEDGNELIVTDNITLYATFTPILKQYTLSIVNIINGDEYPLDPLTYNYGEHIDTSNLPIENNSDLSDRWFVNWYIDKACTIKIVDRVVVNGDITIYASWSKDGAYLVGKLEGYTNEAVRDEYALEPIKSNGTVDYQIEKVFLEAGDYVKVLYHISGISNFVSKWAINISDNEICSSSGDKLTINRTGYYSFYFDKDTTTVTVEFIEYVIHYDGNGYETTYEDYYFDTTEANPFEIHTEYDRTVDMSATINSPDIIGLESSKVLFGWYTEPSGGSRVTKITPMTVYRNSITLYAQYKSRGYYVGGLDDTNLCSNTSLKFDNIENAIYYESGKTFDIYYINGSVYGSRCISDNIKGTNNVIISEEEGNDGKYVTITIATEGYYWIYVKDDCLYIDQYHEVTYNFGSVVNISDKTVNSGTDYYKYGTKLGEVVATDATFTGWKNDATNTVVSYPYVVNNAAYTALYIIGINPNPTTVNKTDYTVYYYVEGELYGVGSISAAKDVLLPTLTKPGYKIQWYLDPNNNQTKVTSVTATNNLTLYGKWVIE